MARRKSAQKIPKKQSIRKSIVRASKFPAELLPSELIHMIFTYLEPKEAAAFRLLGRVVAEIGLQYLVPTAYLALNEESYDRLLAISEHPVVSKYVVKLKYETEGLRFINRHQWDLMITNVPTIYLRDAASETPQAYASARTWRAYNRESARRMSLLNRRRTTRALNRAWLMYEGYHASQKRVQQAHFFPEKIAEAMKQFPNLKTIFATADGAHRRYLADIHRLLPTYCLLGYDQSGMLSIADTTSSILSAAESVNLRYQHFLFQSIKLQTIGQINNNLPTLKKSMVHLETMNLDLTALKRDIEGNGSSTTENLEKGYIKDLVTSAQNLQHFSLAFNMWSFDFAYIPFDKSIGGFHWPFLKAVSLVGLCSHKRELWDFFERHARTLKHLSLKNMHQYEGSWHITFQNMRRVFAFGQNLKTCKLSGYFTGRASSFINIEDTVVSNYIQATDFEDVSLKEYCEMIGVRPY